MFQADAAVKERTAKVFIQNFNFAGNYGNGAAMSEVTRTASQAETANASRAAEELLSLLYVQLRKLAAEKLSRERPGKTLQATALVHEAWLRLGADHQPAWQNRAHFFAAAAEAMRRILVDDARRKNAERHGGKMERVALDGLEIPAPMDDEQLLAVHEALNRLAAHDPLKAELVKLKFFAGLTTEEAAKVLNISEATAKRYWSYARAWLFREIKGANNLNPGS